MKITRRGATLVATLCIAALVPASSAVAGPVKVPQNCHEWNELLGIDNVRSCDDNHS